MAEYNAYGELYDQRPELLIHERLRHSGVVRELVGLAAEQNFHVSFEKGPFRQDMMIKWNDAPGRKEESHTVSSGLKYFQRLKSIRG
jgi:hypothetical protein